MTHTISIRISGKNAYAIGIDATEKRPGEGFKRPWPQLIKMDEAVKARVEELFGKGI